MGVSNFELYNEKFEDSNNLISSSIEQRDRLMLYNSFHHFLLYFYEILTYLSYSFSFRSTWPQGIAVV